MVDKRASITRKAKETTNKFCLFGEDVVLKLLLYSGVIILALIFIELKDQLRNITSFQSNIQRLLGGIHFPASQHKNLFPIDHADVVGSFLVAVSLMIAASGGIGGGGILVPLLIMVFGFHPKYAIPLCNSTVFGSSITNVFLNVSKRHPEADRPLIDWDLVLLMEPLTIAGAIIGTIIDKMVPNQALTISLVILLAYTACSTLVKARSQYIGENRAREMKRQAVHFEALKSDGDTIDKISDIFQDDVVVGIETEDGYISANPALPDHVKSNVDEVALLIESEKNTPIHKVCLLALMVTIVVGLNILKGGGGKSPLGIKCGTAEYWALTVFIMFWMCTVSLWVRSKLIQKWKLKQRIKYCSVEGDIEWNERNTIVYPLLCSFAGLLAGLFGVGGGIVNGPLMLHLGVHPSVSAATSAVMIIATSAAASTMFIFITLTWDYALFLFLIGTVSTIIGQFGVGYFVDKYRRYSYISISIGFVLLISAFLLGVQSLFIITDTANLTGEYLCTV